MTDTKYLDDAEAADYTGMKLSYFRRQLSLGTGPTHVRPSPRVALFLKEDLDAWMASWKVVKSTKS